MQFYATFDMTLCHRLCAHPTTLDKSQISNLKRWKLLNEILPMYFYYVVSYSHQFAIISYRRKGSTLSICIYSFFGYIDGKCMCATDRYANTSMLVFHMMMINCGNVVHSILCIELSSPTYLVHILHKKKFSDSSIKKFCCCFCSWVWKTFIRYLWSIFAPYFIDYHLCFCIAHSKLWHLIYWARQVCMKDHLFCSA